MSSKGRCLQTAIKNVKTRQGRQGTSVLQDPYLDSSNEDRISRVQHTYSKYFFQLKVHSTYATKCAVQAQV